MKNLISFFALAIIFVGTISCSKSGKRTAVYVPTENMRVMDSLYVNMRDSIEFFISQNAQYFENNEYGIFWESTDPHDTGFKKIFLKKNGLNIARRPITPSSRAMSYSLVRRSSEYGKYSYYIESKQFYHGEETKNTQKLRLHTPNDMKLALKIFKRRLQEASDVLNSQRVIRENSRKEKIYDISKNG